MGRQTRGIKIVKWLGWFLLAALPLYGQMELAVSLDTEVSEERPMVTLPLVSGELVEVWSPVSTSPGVEGDVLEHSPLDSFAQHQALEDVQSFLTMSADLVMVDAVDALEVPLKAQAGFQELVLRAFKPQKTTQALDVPWSLTPFRIWTHGPAGQIRVEADEALEAGDVDDSEALRAEYWQKVNQGIQRRELFQRVDAEVAARSRRGGGNE